MVVQLLRGFWYHGVTLLLCSVGGGVSVFRVLFSTELVEFVG